MNYEIYAENAKTTEIHISVTIFGFSLCSLQIWNMVMNDMTILYETDGLSRH